MPAAAFAPDPQRRALLAKAHLAAKELHLARDDYLAVVRRITGKPSAAACTIGQLESLVAEFRRLGWKPAVAARAAPGRRVRPADHPSARKARALWISLYQLGAIDKADERSLEAFARRQLRCDHMQWADQAKTDRLIEALKAIAARHGWDARWETAADQVKALIQAIDAKIRAIDPAAPTIEERFGTLWHREPMPNLYSIAHQMAVARMAAEARR